MCDSGGWLMLADDWYYTLWHKQSTRPAIGSIGASHEVFAYSVGEGDRSFDFVHYQNGKLARAYVVESPNYSDRIVVENIGTPLPGETALLREDGDNIGIQLAETLGIKTRFKDDELRIYVPPEEPQSLKKRFAMWQGLKR